MNPNFHSVQQPLVFLAFAFVCGLLFSAGRFFSAFFSGAVTGGL